MVAGVLLLNISVTAWAATAFGLSGGIGTINRDNCSTIKNTGRWLHIGINVVSSMLLGASNYYMQCLCSPTRQEVDTAHSQRMWLDIGIQSMRNLGKIKRTRMILWICLAATSIPLHLMSVYLPQHLTRSWGRAVFNDFTNISKGSTLQYSSVSQQMNTLSRQ